MMQRAGRGEASYADGTDASGSKSALVSPIEAEAAFVRMLRRVCIAGRRPPLKVLAANSGVSEARLRKFLHRDPLERRAPKLHELLSILLVLGPEAATMFLEPTGLGAHDPDAEDGCLHGGVTAIVSGAAALAAAAENGDISDWEEAGCEAAMTLIDKGTGRFRARLQERRRR